MSGTADVRCLVFDLDGTISDPASGILESMNHALRAFGHNELDERAIGQYIGPPLDRTFRELVPGVGRRDVERLVGKYRERYAEFGYARNTIYPGMAGTLRKLKECGLRLGVCTSKRADFAERILDLFGIRSLFAFVSGGDIGVTKAMQLARLLDDGTVGGDAVMLGDRGVDIEAARANGLAGIGVLWGYGSREELSRARPDGLLERVADLEGFA